MGSTSLASYTYDAMGRRIVENSTHLYYSAQWQVLEERDRGGSATIQYVWSPVYVDALDLRNRNVSDRGLGRCVR